MLGAELQFRRDHSGECRFYDTANARQRRPWSSSSGGGGGVKDEKTVWSSDDETGPVSGDDTRPSNLNRFLEFTTPSVPAQYISKTRIRGWRTSEPYFTLMDLWESFKEWSAYGAGVPLVLDESDCVVQYYVPYLSGIQLYGDPTRQSFSSRRAGEESCIDSKDSSSEGSDGETDRILNHTENNRCYDASMLEVDRLSLREMDDSMQEGFSSDDSDTGNSQGCLLFQYFERNPPYCREPLADKVLDLARMFPVLRTLKSCDLSPASWISVAWYPIYRIPTGRTLKDLDACFLTFHSLSTAFRAAGNSPGPTVTYPQGVDGVPVISLPTFGLASYKLKGSVWMPNGGYDLQAHSLQQAAHNWMQLSRVDHPDYQFFTSNGAYCT